MEKLDHSLEESSITSDKVIVDSTFLDYFALNTLIKGELNDFDLTLYGETNSLDFNKIARSLRAEFQLTRTFDLSNNKEQNILKTNESNLNNKSINYFENPSNKDELFYLSKIPKLYEDDINEKSYFNPKNLKLDYSIYATYREKVNKAFAANTDLYTSYGTQLALRNSRTLNSRLSEYSILAFDIGSFQGEKKHNKDLQEVFRYALGGRLNYSYKLIDFGRSKTFNSDYKYIPQTINQGITLNTGINGNVFRYSDSSAQESLTLTFGPTIEIGEFRKPFLDYSKLSLNYVYVQGSDSSPLKFDNTANSFNLVLNYQQQLIGPLLFGYSSEMNIKDGPDYGKVSNAKYTIGVSRRAYSIDGFYKPGDETFGIQFKINNFRYKGISESF